MTGAELQARIDALSTGYRSGCGGPLYLAPGVIRLEDTLRIGNGHPATSPVSLRILSGSGGEGGITSIGTMAGTTVLEWAGPPGLPMIDVVGAPGLVLQGLALRMDGPQGRASHGIRISANNAGSAPSQAVRVADCAVSCGGRPNGNTVGIAITGEQHNDQTDRVVIERTGVRGCAVAIDQDSQQSCSNVVQGCDLVGWRRGVRVTNGELAVLDCTLGDYAIEGDDDYVAVSFGGDPHPSGTPHYSAHGGSAQRNHIELTRGKAFEVGPIVDWPIALGPNNLTLMRKTGETLVVDSHSPYAVLLVDGLTISPIGSQTQTWRVRSRGPIRGEPHFRFNAYAGKRTTGVVERIYA